MHLRLPTARLGSSYKHGVKPHLSLAKSLSLLGKTLAVVHINNNLSPEQSGHLHENVPLVVFNLLSDSIYLSKGEIMGFMQSQYLDISEIITVRPLEPSPILLEEDNDTEESREQKKQTAFEYNEKKFITSPVDIDIHRKVDLQDAEVTKEQQKAFKELCNEYKDICFYRL